MYAPSYHLAPFQHRLGYLIDLIAVLFHLLGELEIKKGTREYYHMASIEVCYIESKVPLIHERQKLIEKNE